MAIRIQVHKREDNASLSTKPKTIGMKTSESTNQMYHIIDIENHSLSIYGMQGLQFGFLITFYLIISLTVITGEAMIVFYIKNYSPKERSINRMILVDQVCI